LEFRILTVMPKLPEYQEDRDFEAVDKAQWERGVLSKTPSVPFLPKKPFKLPKKLLVGLSALVVFLAVIYVGTSYFYPNFIKNKLNPTTFAEPFAHPVNAADIKFPSDEAKSEFLARLQSAAGERDEDKRYEYLENAFAQLRGFYTLSSDPSYRVQLDAYRGYMQTNYPDQLAKNSALYNYPCLDKECGQVKDPDVILGIRKSIARNTAIDKQTQEAIIRDFDAAALNSDKDFTGNMYNAALTLISSEAIRTQNAQLFADEAKLKEFMKANFAEIPVVENIVE